MKTKRKNDEQTRNWGAPIGMGLAMGTSFGVTMNEPLIGIMMFITMTIAFYPVFNQADHFNHEQDGE